MSASPIERRNEVIDLVMTVAVNDAVFVIDRGFHPTRSVPDRCLASDGAFLFCARAACCPLAYPLEDDVEHWDHENPEQRRGNHAPEYRRAHRPPAERAGALGDN